MACAAVPLAAALERRLLRLRGLALGLAEHARHFLEQALGLDAGPHGIVGADGLGPDPVQPVPTVAVLLERIDDLLGWFVLGLAIAELNGHLAVAPALEEAHAGNNVDGDAKRVGGDGLRPR